MRENKRQINVGGVVIGGSNKVVIQSMTNTKTSNITDTINQINSLKALGCEIVRVAVVDMEDALAIKKIKENVDIPIVADIHFNYLLALEAINSGADKIRINPGNIENEAEIKAIIERCKEKHIPIRVGINSGSLEKSLLEKYGGVVEDALLESVEKSVKRLENNGFYDIVLSIKATDIKTTIKVNEELDKRYNYPLHIGLTESGTINAGVIRSSYTLATLLNQGIGSTIRVSLHGDPVNEIPVCKEILSMCNLYNKPTLIVCPTCGRTNYNMTPIVEEIEKFIENINSNIKIAIMGCIVNGPGEAKEADIGIAGGKNQAVLIRKGQIVEKLHEDEIVERLKKEILNLI